MIADCGRSLLYSAALAACAAAGLLAVGCQGDHVRSQQPTTLDMTCDLVRKVEAATKAADPQVRRGAVYLLGRRGPASSINVVGARLADPDQTVKQAAFEAVSLLGLDDVATGQIAASYLLECLQDPYWGNRRMALGQLTACCSNLRPEQIAAVRRCLDDEAGDVQIAAGLVLARAGFKDDLEQRVVEWIDQYSGNYALDRTLGALLDCIRDPAHMKTAEALCGSVHASVRYHAQVACARLEGAPERWREAVQVEKEFVELREAAHAALRRSSWAPVPRAEVLQQARDARLVLFGEIHQLEGPIRDAQAQVLRAFVKNPSCEALGFEPSAESAQRGIIDLAQSLGLRVIPLETHWDDLSAMERWGARDVEACAAIETILGENPSNRMFVIRGEDHVQPGGLLVRRLKEEPLILLSIQPVPLCVGGLSNIGSTYRLDGSPRTYFLDCDDQSSWVYPALTAWLAAH